MTGLPRIATKSLIKTPALLIYPVVDGDAMIGLRAKAHSALWVAACPSNLVSLQNCHHELFRKEDILKAYPSLDDPLRPYLAPRPDADTLAMSKLPHEFSVFRWMLQHGDVRQRIESGQFVEVLLDIHRRLAVGASSSFRRSPMSMAPDANGVRIVMPDPTCCAPLMEQLGSYLKMSLSSQASLAALVAFVAIVHAHPFNDGNGRTARVYYNLIMHSGMGGSHYLPISFFALINGGTFLIKLRRAMYGGEWGPIQHFLLDATRLSAKLQQSSA